MQCSDTGSHEAIRLPELEMDVLRDINDAMGGIRSYGHGTGQIILSVVNGVITMIDITSRKHRKPGKKQQSA